MEGESIYATFVFTGSAASSNTWQSGNGWVCCHASGAPAAAAGKTPNMKIQEKKITFPLRRDKFYLPNIVIFCSWLLFLYFLHTAPVLFLVFCKFLVWLLQFWANYSMFWLCVCVNVFVLYAWMDYEAYSPLVTVMSKASHPPKEERDPQTERNKWL